jgi:hypothetical protein
MMAIVGMDLVLSGFWIEAGETMQVRWRLVYCCRGRQSLQARLLSRPHLRRERHQTMLMALRADGGPAWATISG